MSRLLTLLLLYRSGFIVGKYISVEMLIEKLKEQYYETLHQSSKGWHENENSYLPFVRYMLGILVKALSRRWATAAEVGIRLCKPKIMSTYPLVILSTAKDLERSEFKTNRLKAMS